MKRSRWKKLLLAGVLGVSTLAAVDAEAGIVTDRVPMLTYADHTVHTFDKPGGKQRGFISPNVSLVMIRQIRPDGWAYGSYPIAGGKRVYRWFQMQDLQGYWDFSNYVTTFDTDQVVYRTSAQAAKTGKLLGKQEVLVVGEEGNHLKIIYRVNGGSEWKMGWVTRVIPSVEPSDVLPYDPSFHLPNDTGVDDSGNQSLDADSISYEPMPYAEDNREDVSYEDTQYVIPSADVTQKENNSESNIEGDDKVNGQDGGNTPLSPQNSVIPQSIMALIRGDVNNDGQVDATDKNMLVSYQIGKINSMPAIDSGDLNGDGKIDILDTVAIKMLLLPGNGDLNGDGKINANDLLNLAEYLAGQRTSLQTKNADINRDGILNRMDIISLIQVIKNVGRGCGDLNGDGKLDSADMELMQQTMNGNPNMQNNRHADLDGDGKGGTQSDVNLLESILRLLQ